MRPIKFRAWDNECKVIRDYDELKGLTLDALTGIVYEDDNQIVHMSGDKFYTDNPRVELTITKFKF